MENLELEERILNLGKLFVKELNLDPGVDTFSRWISHYLAEKITTAELAKGEEREIVRKECFELILKLWNHRYSLPSGRRPFENFEPILDTLKNLNPNRQDSYFYIDLPKRNKKISEIDNLDYKSTKEWMDMVIEIDKTARIWIEFIINKATSNAKSESTKQWIESSIKLPDSIDSNVIKILIENNSLFDTNNHDKFQLEKQYNIENYNTRIAQLEHYNKLNEKLLKLFKEALNNL